MRAVVSKCQPKDPLICDHCKLRKIRTGSAYIYKLNLFDAKDFPLFQDYILVVSDSRCQL